MNSTLADLINIFVLQKPGTSSRNHAQRKPFAVSLCILTLNYILSSAKLDKTTSEFPRGK